MAPHDHSHGHQRYSHGAEEDVGKGEVGREQYVLVSDYIYMQSESISGYITAEGFTDMHLAIQSEQELVSLPTKDFGDHAVFRVLPQQMYTMSKQLRAFEASTGHLATAERDLQRRQLMDEVLREKAHNESEVENSTGREVRYGKVIQLQHVASGKLMAVSHLASTRSRDARQVHMCDSDVGDSAWFRIMPKLRVHTEGKRVRASEPVILESVMSGLKLQVRTHMQPIINPRRSRRAHLTRHCMGARCSLCPSHSPLSAPDVHTLSLTACHTLCLCCRCRRAPKPPSLRAAAPRSTRRLTRATPSSRSSA